MKLLSRQQDVNKYVHLPSQSLIPTSNLSFQPLHLEDNNKKTADPSNKIVAAKKKKKAGTATLVKKAGGPSTKKKESSKSSGTSSAAIKSGKLVFCIFLSLYKLFINSTLLVLLFLFL